MLLYRLVVQRLIVYLELDKLSPEKEKLNLLLKKKPKEVYKTKLKVNPTLNHYVTILLTVVVFMIFLSIPFHALQTPSHIFKEHEYYVAYHIALIIEDNTEILDYFIVVFILMLVYASYITVRHAIANTKIDMSPWVEQGKYTLPPKRKRSFIINISR